MAITANSPLTIGSAGVQAAGDVGACIKHYVANDQEFERFTISADLDERTLRELYLRPFEAAVAEAHVQGVMGAYNFVTGLLYLPASLVAGALWTLSPSLAFGLATALSLAAMVIFVRVRPAAGPAH